MPLSLSSGTVIKAQSGFFTIRTETGDWVCHLRGRLKQQKQSTDLIAVGDRVEISIQPDGGGMIETIAPRHSVLSRKAPSGYGASGLRRSEGEAEQVLVANPDQVVLVFACAEPAPHLRMLDRYLVATEGTGLPAVICANKSDLILPEAAQKLFGLYAPLGYPVVYTSATTNAGLAELRAQLQDKLSVFTGPSGVGKSSLLNALQPGLGLKARAVSQATYKGRHTTVHPELFSLDKTSFVADTPGLRTLDLWDIEPEELDGYFVEIRPYVSQCAYNDCTHVHEPDCAVRNAVANGKIALSRYESYCRLRTGDAGTVP
jgi:ribosome biogenesis GTPase / thiamine phosphate phosphatase